MKSRALVSYKICYAWILFAENSFCQISNREVYVAACRLIRQLTSPVFFSTSDDGKIAQGLSNIPTDRPILLVGYHMFLGIELGVLVSEVFKETNILVRGLAHPGLVGREYEGERQPDPSHGDGARLFGAVPSNGRTMYRLLKHGGSALLYPGGSREALHRKVCLLHIYLKGILSVCISYVSFETH